MTSWQLIGALTVSFAVSIANARNVITEWSTDHADDYIIDQQQVPPYDDYRVVILANSHPEKVWKFQAWNDVEDVPGYINYIKIKDGPTIGGIQLSVVGQPPRLWGAGHLDSLDLLTNGDDTNTIDTIRISADYGALGPMKAGGAGTLTIGGSALDAITLGDVTGPLTITGSVLNTITVGDISAPWNIAGVLGARLEAGNITAPVTIGQLAASLGCASMQNLTVNGPTPQGPVGGIVVSGDYLAPYTMEIGQAVNGVTVSGSLLSGGIHATAVGTLNAVTLSGSVQVDTDLGTLAVNAVAGGGVVDVGGSIDLVTLSSLAGSITTETGDVGEADIDSIEIGGLLDVGHDLGGGASSLFILYGLAGTVRVRNDLLPSATAPYDAAEIGWFLPPGKLEVYRDAWGIEVGEYYGPEALPADTSITVGMQSDGVLRDAMVLGGTAVGGSVTINGQDQERWIYVSGMLNGTISGNELGGIDIAEDVSELGSISATYVFGPLYFLEDMNGLISGEWIAAEINLLSGNLNGTVQAQRISGSLEDPNDGVFVDGDLGGIIQASWAMDAPIEVVQNFSGQINCTGTVWGLYSPIVVHGNMTGNASLTAAKDFSGRLEVGGALSGAVSVTGELSGTLSAVAGMTADLSVGSVSGTGVISAGTITGPIAVGTDETPGNMSGSIAAGVLGGAITITGDLDGALSASSSQFPMTADVWVKGNASGSISAPIIDGPIVVGTDAAPGSMSGGIAASVLGGPITITGGLSGVVSASDPLSPMTSDVWVKGNLAGRISAPILDGTIVVGQEQDPNSGDMSGTLEAGTFGNTISIWHDLTGTIGASQGALTSSIWIGHDVAATGLISAPDGTVGAWTTGTIEVGGSLSGTIDCAPLCDTDPDTPAYGHIIVHGSFLAPGHITLRGVHCGGHEFVAVAYDYADPSTYWDEGATITMAGTDYNHTYVDGHLFEIGKCRGDMDSDGTVGFPDINPFIMALGSAETYALTYPGLGGLQPPWEDGSRVYHGDADCDQPPEFGFSDINPFIALVTAGCCTVDCSPCDAGGGNGMEGGVVPDGDLYPPGLPSPEELAAQLATNVWPELYDGLLSMVLAAIDSAPDEQTQAYWQAVYTALTQ